MAMIKEMTISKCSQQQTASETTVALPSQYVKMCHETRGYENACESKSACSPNILELSRHDQAGSSRPQQSSSSQVQAEEIDKVPVSALEEQQQQVMLGPSDKKPDAPGPSGKSGEQTSAKREHEPSGSKESPEKKQMKQSSDKATEDKNKDVTAIRN